MMEPTSLRSAWLAWLRTLYTGYFACVMATGIVSIALLLSGIQMLSALLLIAACVLLPAFVIIYALRGLLFARELWHDFLDPARVFGFFTFVAACGVLATRFALGGAASPVAVLTVVAFAAWLFLMYWVFAMLIFTNEHPPAQSVNGSWLIAIVGTESLAIAWVLLTRLLPDQQAVLQLLAYAFWTFGVLLYLIFITFIVYRFAFARITPHDLTPPYWINMGAMAITTVAGVRLLQVGAPAAFIVAVHPYIEGFTLMMWAWGTWWIPLLMIIGVWKYAVAREPLRYDPSLWSMVFPMGMYSVAVQLLSRLPGLAFLGIFGPWITWIAFAAWVLVAASWLWSIAAAVRRIVSSPSAARPVTTAISDEQRVEQHT